MAKQDHHNLFWKAFHWLNGKVESHKGPFLPEGSKDGPFHVEFLLATIKSRWDIIYGENTSKLLKTTHP